MKLLRLLILFIVFQVSAQQGGMWIPSMLEGKNEKEMQSLGMKMTAADIYSINNSSLKDAVIHFNGGCTSELISSRALLLTNHHCGYGAIQSHSSVDHDYLKDGFWAMTDAEELPNPGMVATLIVRIDDITNKAFEGISDSMEEQEKLAKISQNLEKIQKEVVKESWQDVFVKSIYHGNQYLLYVTEVFKDIRLVGAPPSSVGKFGSDTDNWMWPRHTGDFSLFRIYASKDNKPATYSKDNVPYIPKHFLPISLDGIAEGDFTMVFGFPGRTNEYLPAIAVDQLANKLNPARIEIRDTALKIVDSYMRKDQQIKIQYASKYASIANHWKKWIGESQGIQKSGAVNIKKKLESDFNKLVAEKGLQNQYGTLLPDFNRLYKEIEDVSLANDYWSEVVNRNIELLSATVMIYQLEQTYEKKGTQAFEDAREKLSKRLEGFYKNYNATVDKAVFERLIEIYANNIPRAYLSKSLSNADFKKLADDIYKKSKLTNFEGASSLLSGTPSEFIRKINKDKGYQLGKELTADFYANINPKFVKTSEQIATVQKVYMKALLELFPDERIFPDANSTLRITYGKVSGYQPKDAVYYNPVSYLDGIMEKYIPNDYEFDVPQKLIELNKTKDFGSYGIDGKMPVCFIGTNHTTGGNSGSPAIDAHGNLIGLNFDRVWEGTMSDLYYDPAISRNIMVDVRYVLFIVDKYAGATRLIEEMKLVHPKKKN
ncbi:MAG: S46 family peptidase [Flavobacteriaceae bacterium]|nr:S46 family peptidase [Flavobacteriaceae bacterium]